MPVSLLDLGSDTISVDCMENYRPRLNQPKNEEENGRLQNIFSSLKSLFPDQDDKAVPTDFMETRLTNDFSNEWEIDGENFTYHGIEIHGVNQTNTKPLTNFISSMCSTCMFSPLHNYDKDFIHCQKSFGRERCKLHGEETDIQIDNEQHQPHYREFPVCTQSDPNIRRTQEVRLSDDDDDFVLLLSPNERASVDDMVLSPKIEAKIYEASSGDVDMVWSPKEKAKVIEQNTPQKPSNLHEKCSNHHPLYQTSHLSEVYDRKLTNAPVHESVRHTREERVMDESTPQKSNDYGIQSYTARKETKNYCGSIYNEVSQDDDREERKFSNDFRSPEVQTESRDTNVITDCNEPSDTREFVNTERQNISSVGESQMDKVNMQIKLIMKSFNDYKEEEEVKDRISKVLSKVDENFPLSGDAVVFKRINDFFSIYGSENDDNAVNNDSRDLECTPKVCDAVPSNSSGKSVQEAIDNQWSPVSSPRISASNNAQLTSCEDIPLIPLNFPRTTVSSDLSTASNDVPDIPLNLTRASASKVCDTAALISPRKFVPEDIKTQQNPFSSPGISTSKNAQLATEEDIPLIPLNFPPRTSASNNHNAELRKDIPQIPFKFTGASRSNASSRIDIPQISLKLPGASTSSTLSTSSKDIPQTDLKLPGASTSGTLSTSSKDKPQTHLNLPGASTSGTLSTSSKDKPQTYLKLTGASTSSTLSTSSKDIPQIPLKLTVASRSNTLSTSSKVIPQTPLKVPVSASSTLSTSSKDKTQIPLKFPRGSTSKDLTAASEKVVLLQSPLKTKSVDKETKLQKSSLHHQEMSDHNGTDTSNFSAKNFAVVDEVYLDSDEDDQSSKRTTPSLICLDEDSVDKQIPTHSKEPKSTKGNENLPVSAKNSKVKSSVKSSKDASDNVKSYHMPFRSNDPLENMDNEDPKWNYLKQLETDEERYRFSRERWKSLVVPDPNVCLTVFSNRVRQKRAVEPANIVRKRRLKPSEQEEHRPMHKRLRPLNVTFTHHTFDNAMQLVTNEYVQDYGQRQNLYRKYQEKIHMLDLAKSEIIAFHKFFEGLPNQSQYVTQSKLEQEHVDHFRLYQQFKKLYNWNGSVFVP